MYFLFKIFSGEVLEIYCPMENCDCEVSEIDINLFVEDEVYEKYK